MSSFGDVWYLTDRARHALNTNSYETYSLALSISEQVRLLSFRVDLRLSLTSFPVIVDVLLLFRFLVSGSSVPLLRQVPSCPPWQRSEQDWPAFRQRQCSVPQPFAQPHWVCDSQFLQWWVVWRGERAYLWWSWLLWVLRRLFGCYDFVFCGFRGNRLLSFVNQQLRTRVPKALHDL